MKTKNLLKTFILLLSTVAFFSCGGSDDGGGGGGNGGGQGNQTTSITISASSSSIELGQSVSFTVKDNNNSNKTSQSTIYVNGNAISGSSFTPDAVGSYSVNAKYNSLTSSNITVNVTGSSVSVIVISADKYLAYPNERFTFSALGNGGVDLTNDVTYYVDGTAISGNEYTPTDRGNYSITAKLDDVDSNEINVIAGYVQKVLVEDYTGTWCGYCPRIAHTLEQAEGQSNDIYGVAIHNGSTNPMVYEYEAQMRAEFGVSGFPTGKINRTVNWNNDSSMAELLNARGVNGKLGLALESSLSGSTISVDVKVGYIDAVNGAKIVGYLLEDGKVYPQVNYMNDDSSSPWYQAGNPIDDYVHNNILRKSFTNVFGDVIPNAVAGDEYTTTLTMDMPSNVEDETKLQIVVFVVDSNKTAINAMRVDLGESQDYQ